MERRCVRESFAVVRALVDGAGVTARLGHGGKHAIVFLTAPNGGVHRIPISTSPVNADHQLRNVKQQVRSWLERCGLAGKRGSTVGPGRKRRKRSRMKSTIYRIEVGGSRIAEDPWSVLAGHEAKGEVNHEKTKADAIPNGEA